MNPPDPRAERIARTLTETTARLRSAGVEGADRDAKRLMAHHIGVAPHVLTAPFDHPQLLDRFDPAPEAQAALRAMVEARAGGKPVSKIIGRRAFWTFDFIVTDDVLDPRPETETLVELALREPFGRVLDMGTGSGCILISLLLENRQATGLGTDLSLAALSVAERNAEAAKVASRVRFIPSDWYKSIDGSYDLIVSNPPYIAADEMAGLMPEVRDHDPHIALTDDGDGLTAYRAIAAGAAAYLAPGGRILVEIGPTQAAAVSTLFSGAGLEKIAVHPDLDGRDRVVEARRT